MSVEGSKEPDPALVLSSRSTEPDSPSPQNYLTDQSGTFSNSVDRVNVPFADFVGRCFLRGCLWGDLLISWIRKKQAHSDASIVSETNWTYHFHVMGWWRSSLGAVSCTAAAGCLIPFVSRTSLRAVIPLLFLLVILYVALRFGNVAGMIGTVCAALVFEIFLFKPTLSLAIHNSVARNHLISMVILGVCASELLGRRKRSVEYKPW
ncbi:MAG TPA: DUF4118 domain-containing protein [Terriglobales bacterium]|jgi:hypothetical protein|nr:DUF4118 domain-containing protein [Terriglobales bacterium]